MNTKRFVLAGVLIASASCAVYGQAEKAESSQRAAIVKPRVMFKLNSQRDPMLSPDDVLLLRAREQNRLAMEAAERRRQVEAERKRKAEEERKRQWELLLLKDPTVVVRNKIKIGGIIDKEVLIGGKLYTIGNTYMGAKIISVSPESVTFSYKGRKFTKKVPL